MQVIPAVVRDATYTTKPIICNEKKDNGYYIGWTKEVERTFYLNTINHN